MRFTEKKEKYIKELKTNGHIYFVDDILPNNCKLTGRSIEKLGQLEDIEDELGIDLITLFKAMKQVKLFYKDENDNINQCEFSRLGFQLSPAFIFMYKGYDENNYLKCVACEPVWRYGKTWALTKEELENV